MTDGYFQVIADPVSTLRPGDFGIAFCHPTLRHEVVDAALPILGTGIPVLDRRVLDLAAVESNQFHDCCV